MRQTETHPDLDRWIAYRAGDLVDDEQSVLQDHLAACSDCTRLILDLESFAGSTSADRQQAGAGFSEIEKAAVWRMLRPQVAANEDQRPTRQRWQMPATLAASLLLAAFGLGLWLQQQELTGLRQQIAELSKPQANLPIYDLVPDVTVRGESAPGGTPELNSLTLPRGVASYALILNRTEIGEPGKYRAEILAEGEPVLTIEDLESDELGIFTLRLPPVDALAEGDYVLRLYGLEDGREAALEDYPLRLIHR